MTDMAVLEREETKTFDLASSPCHLIHRAQQFAADRFSEEMAGASITQRQFAVLIAVAENEGLTQTDLVRATGIDRSTLAELVARMADRNLLLRERAKTDARANTVSLTAEGRALLADATPRVERADEAILEALPKPKRAAFLETLQRIARVLDDPDSLQPPEESKKKKVKKTKEKAPKKAKAADSASKSAAKSAAAKPKPAGKPTKKSKKTTKS